eukprot:GEMP01007069.1.p1 GENE.GEMP01007069.1~~GEMP01007069.1.p1  ORF type:complete len:976 (+),score=239.66 GEMP01007069.1:121-3048(+)
MASKVVRDNWSGAATKEKESANSDGVVSDWEKLLDSDSEDDGKKRQCGVDENVHDSDIELDAPAPPPPPPAPVVLTAPIKQKKKKQALLKMADMDDSMSKDAYGAGASAAARNVEKMMEKNAAAKKKAEKVKLKKMDAEKKEDSVIDDWEDMDETQMDKKVAERIGELRHVDHGCRRDEKGRPLVMTIPKLLEYQQRSTCARPLELLSFRSAELDQYGNIRPRVQPKLDKDKPMRRTFRPEPPLLHTLHQSRNAYRVSAHHYNLDDSGAKEQLVRDAKSSLNKLSPENFEALSGKVGAIDVKTESELVLITDLIFNKAVTEHNYCEMYSELCVVLSTRYPSFPSSEPDRPALNFTRALLSRCQKEFEALPTTFEEVPSGVVDPELYLSKLKERVLGHMKFIGQLFLRRMLSHKVVKDVVEELICRAPQPADHFVECICILIRNIGSELEITGPGAEYLATFMARLQALLELDYPKRIKFAIEGVMELEKSRWRDRPWRETAKTKEEIRQDQNRPHHDNIRDQSRSWQASNGPRVMHPAGFLAPSIRSKSASSKALPTSVKEEILEIVLAYAEHRDAGETAKEWERVLFGIDRLEKHVRGNIPRGSDTLQLVEALVMLAYEEHFPPELVAELVVKLDHQGVPALEDLFAAFLNQPPEKCVTDFPHAHQVYHVVMAALLMGEPDSAQHMVKHLPLVVLDRATFSKNWLGILRRIRDVNGIPAVKTALQMAGEFSYDAHTMDEISNIVAGDVDCANGVGTQDGPGRGPITNNLPHAGSRCITGDPAGPVEDSWEKLKECLAKDDFSPHTLVSVIGNGSTCWGTSLVNVLSNDAFLQRLIGVVLHVLATHFPSIAWFQRLGKVKPLFCFFTDYNKSACTVVLDGLVDALIDFPKFIRFEDDLDTILRFFFDEHGLDFSWGTFKQWAKDPVNSSDKKSIVVLHAQKVMPAKETENDVEQGVQRRENYEENKRPGSFILKI